ncbi:MAG TPA: EI24 domain-containing protein [Sandaracinaceae bacterium LLY-WYZ-13_1]|nr:EI24 domain-containing protein [Sandaracinaceae bacterium LLY-WYZ-13_1]
MGFKDGAKVVAKKAVSMPSATVVGFWKGLTYPFKGAKIVFFQHPGLVKYWGVPIVLTGLLLVGALWAGWAWHEDVTDAMWVDPTEQADPGALSKRFEGDLDKAKPATLAAKAVDGDPGFWMEAGHWAHSTLEVLVLLLLWTLGLLAVVFLTNVIAAPFNDLLSEEVEYRLTGRKGPDFTLTVLVRDSVRTVGLEVVKMVVYLVIMVPLYLLSLLLPAVGQVIYSIFAFLFTALYFSLDYVDWPASRRNRSLTYRFGMLTDHFMPMFGFGTGVWLFLFIPIVNLLFMPAAVAGGTLLFLDLEGETAAAGDRGTGARGPDALS